LKTIEESYDWIEQALGKKKKQKYSTDEERLEARRARQRKYQAKLRAQRKAEKEKG
jgi:hypothetical protein